MLRIIFVGFIIFFLALVITSCNIYSGLAPSDINSVSDNTTLIAMAQQFMRAGNYQKAYDAYNKVVQNDPKNSVAIEGLCTAYFYKEINAADFISNIGANGKAGLAPMANDLYRISGFIKNNLRTIIDQNADGVVDYKNINVNLNFYIFNTIYAVFRISDFDQNGIIINDPKDILTFDNNMNTINNLGNGNFTNNIIQALKTYNILINNMRNFDNDFALTLRSDGYIESQLSSTNVRQYFHTITSNILSIKESLDDTLSNITKSTDYTLSYGSFLSNMGVTNVSPSNVDATISNYLALKYTPDHPGYSNFLSDTTVNTGGTNVSDFVSLMTNTFPDLSTNVGGIYLSVTNYFGI